MGELLGANSKRRKVIAVPRKRGLGSQMIRAVANLLTIWIPHEFIGVDNAMQIRADFLDKHHDSVRTGGPMKARSGVKQRNEMPARALRPIA